MRTISNFERNIEKGIDWVINNYDYFDPYQRKENYPEHISKKSFAEITLIVFAAKKVEKHLNSILLNKIEFLSTQILKTLKSPQLYMGIFKNERSFKPMEVALLIMLKLHPEDELLNKIVLKAYYSGLFDPCVASAFRHYEVKSFLEMNKLIDFDNKEKISLAKQSILGKRQLNLVNMTRLEEYELTHILFYLTEWEKINANHIIMDLGINTIQELVLYLTGKNLLLKNNDLLAELVMNMVHLNVVHPLLDQSINTLCEGQREDGVFEAASYTYQRALVESTTLRSLVDTDRDVVLNYHTTFVSIAALLTYYLN